MAHYAAENSQGLTLLSQPMDKLIEAHIHEHYDEGVLPHLDRCARLLLLLLPPLRWDWDGCVAGGTTTRLACCHVPPLVAGTDTPVGGH